MKALAQARNRPGGSVATSRAHQGVSESPLRMLERNDKARREQLKRQRGTSVARVKRSGGENEEEERLREEMELRLQEVAALDKSALEASLGVASPLPRSVLRPVRTELKVVHGLDGVPKKPDEPVIGL